MKYQRIYEELKTAILRRIIAPNHAVPSEKAITIKYHVSRITAKRALNELAKEGLIYRIQGRGSFVKAHGTSSNHQILLVLPFSGNAELGNYVSGIQEVLKDTTWKLLSITNEEFFNLSISHLKRNYAGIIFYPQKIEIEMKYLVKIYLAKIPIVLLDQTISNSVIPSVVSDNVSGGFIATEHLIKNKCKKIAFYSNTNFWNNYSGSVAARFSGYLTALKKFEITNFNPIKINSKLSKLNNKDLISFIKENQIDGIVTENDIVALKLLELFNKNNLSVPSELKLIGFDNLSFTTLVSPKLSSIGQDFYKLGTNAINLLLRQINDPNLIFTKKVIVPVKLIARESTGGN